MVGPSCPNHYTSLSKTCQRGWLCNTRRLVLLRKLKYGESFLTVFLTIETQNQGCCATPSRAESAISQTKQQTNSKDPRTVSGINTTTSSLQKSVPTSDISFFSEIPRYLGISKKKLICWLGDYSSSPLGPVL